MLAHPLADHALKHPDADLVLVEGTIDGMVDNQRLYIAPLHRHHEDDEIFYIVKGEVGFRIDDDEFIATPGDAVLVVRGQAHTWWAASDQPATYLIAMPKRVDNLINAIHERHRNQDELKQLFADYAAELIEWLA